jgi:hypothetical protein
MEWCPTGPAGMSDVPPRSKSLRKTKQRTHDKSFEYIFLAVFL